MALCDTCAFYNKQIDEFRQQYDDVIDGEKRERHFCVMYEDSIPLDISYKNAECPYYIKGGD